MQQDAKTASKNVWNAHAAHTTNRRDPAYSWSVKRYIVDNNVAIYEPFFLNFCMLTKKFKKLLKNINVDLIFKKAAEL